MKKQYEKLLNTKLTIKLHQIQNIKNLFINDKQLNSPNKKIITPIINFIIHKLILCCFMDIIPNEI